VNTPEYNKEYYKKNKEKIQARHKKNYQEKKKLRVNKVF
jgi:hypothetical protein